MTINTTTKVDTQEVTNRRSRLAHWLKTNNGGSQADFIRGLVPVDDEDKVISSGELSLLLKNKAFGEKKVRKLERQAGMPLKWLDGDSLVKIDPGRLPTYNYPETKYCPRHEKILISLNNAKVVMESLQQDFTCDQRDEIYRLAFELAMGEPVTLEQFKVIVKSRFPN
ncbi:MAG: hypothetical protein BVN35_02925 [Proteobacteria bacterium ST_bin11]|nr:MAG: hypothetical protein BVN35_02925 [Proteobacteria bacterium ST_bin11]